MLQSDVTSRSNLGVGAEDTPQFTQIKLSNPPTDVDHVATKQYVDGSAALIVADTPPSTVTTSAGALWWESDAGMLYVLYDDGDSKQWVQAVAIPSPNLSNYVQKSGDAMSGLLTLSGAPSADLHAATKLYADSKAGEAVVDGRTYARRNLAWSEVPRFERISLAGVKQFDVQVPAGATMARLTGMIQPTAATPTQLIIQLSFVPGVFRSTAGEYFLNGFLQSSVGATIANSNNTATIPGMFVGNHQHGTIPIFFDGTLQLKKPNASILFSSVLRSQTFFSGYIHSFNYGLLAIAASGSALEVLAFRLTTISGGGDIWAADSYLNIEWM